MSEASARMPATRASLMPLWIMIVIFALPMLAAWWLFFNPEYLPEGRKNHGELIDPVLPLDGRFGLQGLRGDAFDPRSLEGQWVLVTVTEGACDAACMEQLIAMRQIRLAVGEDRYVVDRLWVTTDAAGATDLAGRFSGMHVALIGERGIEALREALPAGDRAESRIHILDPMGRLMMRYDADAPAEHVLRDLEHLLKTSRLWIKGAVHGNR